MDKLLLGIVKFRNVVQPTVLPSLKKLAIKAQPRILMITCMDSRLVPASLTSADPGDMFIVRNPGNIMPHNQLYGENHAGFLGERAALELAVSVGVEHVAVCGHSDCKAMTCLHHMDGTEPQPTSEGTFVSGWLRRYGQAALTKFEQLALQEQQGKVVFTDSSQEKDSLEMVFDQDSILSAVDQLSQINVLQQLQHIKSYGFVQRKLQEGSLQLHALWFDINSGEMSMFSRDHRKFVVINDETVKTVFGHLISAQDTQSRSQQGL